MSRSSVVLAVVAGGVAVAALTATGPGAAAADLSGFDGSALAAGVRISVEIDPANLVDKPADSSGPLAQVDLDSLGNSTASAALPHPGEGVMSAPSLIALLGILPPTAPPVPGYPLNASSEASTQPESKVETGPYTLRASSELRKGAASAVARGDVEPDTAAATTRSSASVEVGDDTVRSVAESVTDGVRLGPLSLGHVRTYASAISHRNGSVKLDGGFEIDGAMVGDLALDIDADAVTVLGQRIPLDETATDPLMAAVGLAGLEVEVLPTTRTDTGIDVGGLRLTRVVTVGEGLPAIEGAPGIGVAGTKVTLSVVLGGASAAATAVAPVSSAGGPGSPPGATPGIDLPASASSGTGEAVSAPDPAGSTQPAIQPPAEVATLSSFSTVAFYLVLVFAGVVLSGGVQFARRVS